MGLDAIELVMEVEETFDITIPDDEAGQIRTAGDLFHYILLKLPCDGSGSAGCPSSRAFHRLRRALMDHHGIDRRRVRPGARMAELIPADDLPDAWPRLGRDLGWRLPDLVRPPWLCRALIGGLVTVQFGLILFVWGNLAGFAFEALGAAVCWFAITTPLLLGIAVRLTRPLAIHVPASCETLRGILKTVIPSSSFGTLGRDMGSLPSEVWFTLRRIIAEISGADPEMITEETNFLTDLGFG